MHNFFYSSSLVSRVGRSPNGFHYVVKGNIRVCIIVRVCIERSTWQAYWPKFWVLSRKYCLSLVYNTLPSNTPTQFAVVSNHPDLPTIYIALLQSLRAGLSLLDDKKCAKDCRIYYGGCRDAEFYICMSLYNWSSTCNPRTSPLFLGDVIIRSILEQLGFTAAQVVDDWPQAY